MLRIKVLLLSALVESLKNYAYSKIIIAVKSFSQEAVNTHQSYKVSKCKDSNVEPKVSFVIREEISEFY